MKLDKVISQLEDLMQHCEEFRDKGDSEDIWVKDVQALDVAIKELKKAQSAATEKGPTTNNYYINYNINNKKSEDESEDRFCTSEDIQDFLRTINMVKRDILQGDVLLAVSTLERLENNIRSYMRFSNEEI